MRGARSSETGRRDEPWDAVNFVRPAIPSMVTDGELRYLYWLTSTAWEGAGDVLEVGPWLGGSTACLAAGMLANPRRQSRRLHVCDTFIWKDFMSARAPLGLADGASFRPIVEENLDQYMHLITLHEAALPDESVPDHAADSIRSPAEARVELFRWLSDDPIEIAFVDGAKSWNGLRHLLLAIGPSLPPGKALVVCQDYKYWGSYWVPMAMELLADKLAVEHVLRDNTVTFRVTAQITSSDLQVLPRFEDLTVALGLSLLARSAARLEQIGDAAGSRIVSLAGARFLCHRGDTEGGLAVIRDARRTWPAHSPRGNLRRAEEWYRSEFGVDWRSGAQRVRDGIGRLVGSKMRR